MAAKVQIGSLGREDSGRLILLLSFFSRDGSVLGDTSYHVDEDEASELDLDDADLPLRGTSIPVFGQPLSPNA